MTQLVDIETRKRKCIATFGTVTSDLISSSKLKMIFDCFFSFLDQIQVILAKKAIIRPQVALLDYFKVAYGVHIFYSVFVPRNVMN